MRTELHFDLPAMYGFLLVLARVGAAFALAPFPGFSASPLAARVILSVAVALCLFPQWPAPEAKALASGTLAMWLLGEAAFGMAAGLVVAFLLEGFQLGAQVIGLQAGFSYASTIDPNSQADSSVLQVLTQLTAGLLFFALGFDRQMIGIFSRSLAVYPPGEFWLTAASANSIARLGASMFSTGVRLALPVVALLALVDLTLALMGRVQAQLQLLTLAFPAKILSTLAVLSLLTAILPALMERAAAQSMSALFELVRK